ncbi:hypothetical protein AS361_15230 [Myroides marinus]|nr:hypothetical protein AS361_15230 [Myroides marinus]
MFIATGVNNDLLIWKENFEHISTIFDIRKSSDLKIKNYLDTYIGIYNHEHNAIDELTIFKKE